MLWISPLGFLIQLLLLRAGLVTARNSAQETIETFVGGHRHSPHLQRNLDSKFIQGRIHARLKARRLDKGQQQNDSASGKRFASATIHYKSNQGSASNGQAPFTITRDLSGNSEEPDCFDARKVGWHLDPCAGISYVSGQGSERYEVCMPIPKKNPANEKWIILTTVLSEIDKKYRDLAPCFQTLIQNGSNDQQYICIPGGQGGLEYMQTYMESSNECASHRLVARDTIGNIEEMASMNRGQNVEVAQPEMINTFVIIGVSLGYFVLATFIVTVFVRRKRNESAPPTSAGSDRRNQREPQSLIINTSPSLNLDIFGGSRRTSDFSYKVFRFSDTSSQTMGSPLLPPPPESLGWMTNKNTYETIYDRIRALQAIEPPTHDKHASPRLSDWSRTTGSSGTLSIWLRCSADFSKASSEEQSSITSHTSYQAHFIPSLLPTLPEDLLPPADAQVPSESKEQGLKWSRRLTEPVWWLEYSLPRSPPATHSATPSRRTSQHTYSNHCT